MLEDVFVVIDFLNKVFFRLNALNFLSDLLSVSFVLVSKEKKRRNF